MNKIPLRLKYYSGMDIFDVLNNSELEFEMIMELIKKFGDLPGADVLKVIRCKDCKHSEHWYGDKARCFLWHEEGIDVFEDGFCNYAGRKPMSKEEIIERLEEIAKHAGHVFGEEPFIMSLDDGIAIHEAIDILKSAQPEPISEEYAKAVRTWLINYQVRCAELKGRYTPYEILGWIVSDWRKENETW